VRTIGDQKVVMVLVVPLDPEREPPFYTMENKVWNDLYAAFVADPQAPGLFNKWGSGFGREELLSPEPEWRKGGIAKKINVGVEGKGRFPVFRVTVTEAHCFAEWLGGRHGKLPTLEQWYHAAGKGNKNNERPGPLLGRRDGHEGLAVDLDDGPRPVDWCANHVSVHGCRQMAGNGFEWTCELSDEGKIPLHKWNGDNRQVCYVGQSYCRDPQPLLFQDMRPYFISCTKSKYDIGFRVVLEPPAFQPVAKVDKQ
jgi:formylglycine-generating enzyme required for sulfatase activity